MYSIYCFYFLVQWNWHVVKQSTSYVNLVVCCVVVNNTMGLDMGIRNTHAHPLRAHRERESERAKEWERVTERERERNNWHDLSWHIDSQKKSKEFQYKKKLFSILVQRMCTTRIILICKIETKYVAKAKWTKENWTTMNWLKWKESRIR